MKENKYSSTHDIFRKKITGKNAHYEKKNIAAQKIQNKFKKKNIPFEYFLKCIFLEMFFESNFYLRVIIKKNQQQVS